MTSEALDAFIADPEGYFPGTSMERAADRAALVAYLMGSAGQVFACGEEAFHGEALLGGGADFVGVLPFADPQG